jgi:hypothetical protein
LVSDNERHDRIAFRELEVLIRHLGDELASFRRRALQAETQLRALDAGGGPVVDASRVEALEAENAVLRGRLEAAAGHAQSMLDRVRFLRQQQEQSAAVAGSAGGER